jgi:hypothetical protein
VCPGWGLRELCDLVESGCPQTTRVRAGYESGMDMLPVEKDRARPRKLARLLAGEVSVWQRYLPFELKPRATLPDEPAAWWVGRCSGLESCDGSVLD